ncbi:class I SAM-dependent methyltransferase [Candidatus Aerophobetes bacterium]|nr:class I SAM-dependent methyltransferase [Candidatus Aerophobetes bacterium]
MYPFFKDLAIGLNSIFRPQRVLDVGCGKGFLVEALREISVNAYGIDISKYALTSSGLTYLVLGSAENLPFRDDSFDLVTALEVVEHLENPEKFFIEAKRILKPKGVLFITTPSHRNKIAKQDPTHINIKSRAEWCKILQNLGFEVDKNLEIEIVEIMIDHFSNTKPKSKLGKILERLRMRRQFIFIWHILINPIFYGTTIVAKLVEK